MSRLPNDITSLYRLFLRTASVSVLHHPQATRNLRLLWRPVFEAGASVAKDLARKDTHGTECEERQRWLKVWNERMNNTLSLLYTSSQTRGLPHNLTKNLSWLVSGEHRRVRQYRLKAWDPRRPLALTNPKVDRSEKARRKQEDDKRFNEFAAQAWKPLSQVVKLAEAKDGLTLGRIRVRGWKGKFMRDRGI